MHQALYRKWRPRDFDEVCGQDHVTSILKYEVASGKTTHAYLFCGSRGTGKTSCAKILAKALNCENPKNGNPCNECAACRSIDEGSALDVYEMDAASNNGIDNIRDIRDEVLYTPSELKNRVYIIDEVHMLSTSAFNALLKTLEEPPQNVVFILATTELAKIPATILSRCQRFEFCRIKTQVISDRLMKIAEEEGIKVEPSAAFLISKLAQGGMRDAISMLELCSGENEVITEDTVVRVTGTTGRKVVSDAFETVLKKDYEGIFRLTDSLHTSSVDISVFWGDLIGYYRDLFVTKNTKNSRDYLDLSEGEYEELKASAQKINNATLMYHIKALEDAQSAMQRPNSQKRVIAELCLIKLCDPSLSTSPEAMLDRISALEDKVASGAFALPSFTANEAEEPTDEKAEELQKNAEEPEKVSEKPLRPISDWAEVVKKFSKINMSIFAFLGSSKGYISGNEVVIRTNGQFTIDMLSQTSVKEDLARIISVEEKTPIDPKKIKLELMNKKNAELADGIEEITSNLQ